MSFFSSKNDLGATPGHRLASLYFQVLSGYLVGMILLWIVGYESIYGHPTPFYALYRPAFNTILVPWCLVLLMVLSYWVYSQHYILRARLMYRAGLAGWVILFIVPFVLVYHSGPLNDQPAWILIRTQLLQLSWHLPALLVFIVFFIVFDFANRKHNILRNIPEKRTLRVLLLGLVVTAFCFACAIAMIRGGFQGISQAFMRQQYEVVGDIGLASSFRGMFTRYVELQPHLSLHGRVHPPGPVILVWTFSYIVGRGALGLSLITVAFGSLAIIPLYFWVREMLGHRTALLSTLLYMFIPSIVLFGATSADILFPPFTLATLFFFERTIRRASIPCAIAAGLGYTVMGLMKYSLFGIGAYFAIVGLWLLFHPMRRRSVIQTATVMFIATLSGHLLVWLWSGFDLIESMRIAKEYVDHDRYHEHNLAPRAGFWAWRLLNPLAWFYFAGIPVSVLFTMRLAQSVRNHTARYTPVVYVLALTALVQSMLYLGAGEGERSALYVFPFLVIPAAHLLNELGRKSRPDTTLYATLALLAFQCWLTESYFYTYW